MRILEPHKYVIAETATSTYHYHLRLIGGPPRTAICGKPVGWDTKFPLTSWGMTDHVPSGYCRLCERTATYRQGNLGRNTELLRAGFLLSPPIDIDCSDMTPYKWEELLEEGKTTIRYRGNPYVITRNWSVSEGDLRAEDFQIKVATPKIPDPK